MSCLKVLTGMEIGKKYALKKYDQFSLNNDEKNDFDFKYFVFPFFPYRLEPLKSALDLHRERFAQRLERSTADRTRRQEEAWARLDRCPSPIYEHPKIKR